MSDAAMEEFLRMGEEIPIDEEDKKREAVKEFQDYPEYIKVPRAALLGAMQGASVGQANRIGDFLGELGVRGEGELSTSEKDLLAKTESPYAHLTGEVIGALLGLRGAGTLPLAQRLAVEGGLGAAERVGKGGLSLENLLKGFAWGVVPGGAVEGVKRGVKTVGGKAFARRGAEAAEELAQESLKKEKAIAEATEEAAALRSAKEAEERMLRSQASEKASELLDPANVTRMTAQEKLKAANDLAERYAAIARMAPEKAALEEAKIAMRQADEMLAALKTVQQPSGAVKQAIAAAENAKLGANRATVEALSSDLPARQMAARGARDLAAQQAEVARSAPQAVPLREAKIAKRQQDEMVAALESLGEPADAALRRAQSANKMSSRATVEALGSKLPTQERAARAANDLVKKYEAIARMAPESIGLREAKIAMQQADEMLAALKGMEQPSGAVKQAIAAAEEAKAKAAFATIDALSSGLPAQERAAREAARLAAGERAAVPPLQPNYAEVAREMSKASATKTRTAAEEALQPLMRPVRQAEETLRQAQAALARLPKTPGSEALREIAYRTDNAQGFTRTYARKLLQSILKDPAIMSRLSRGEAPKTLKVLEESLRGARGAANDEISPDEAAMMFDLISYIE
jgi:hypothetical protein